MREDSCSGVGARRDRELEPSGPEGGVGSLTPKGPGNSTKKAGGKLAVGT